MACTPIDLRKPAIGTPMVGSDAPRQSARRGDLRGALAVGDPPPFPRQELLHHGPLDSSVPSTCGCFRATGGLFDYSGLTTAATDNESSVALGNR